MNMKQIIQLIINMDDDKASLDYKKIAKALLHLNEKIANHWKALSSNPSADDLAEITLLLLQECDRASLQRVEALLKPKLDTMGLDRDGFHLVTLYGMIDYILKHPATKSADAKQTTNMTAGQIEAEAETALYQQCARNVMTSLEAYALIKKSAKLLALASADNILNVMNEDYNEIWLFFDAPDPDTNAAKTLLEQKHIFWLNVLEYFLQIQDAYRSNAILAGLKRQGIEKLDPNSNIFNEFIDRQRDVTSLQLLRLQIPKIIDLDFTRTTKAALDKLKVNPNNFFPDASVAIPAASSAGAAAPKPSDKKTP